MDAIKAKIAVWAKDKRLIKRTAIVAGAALILIICLCISIGMRSNIQKKYSATIDRMQEQVYQNLTTMTELFARIDDPTVDVRNKLIPALQAQYETASAVNRILAEAGAKYALLNEDQIAAFDAAFEQYTTAYRADAPTGLAKADMSECIEDITPMVVKHNNPVDKNKEDVVIIDASSGKIQETEEAAQ